MVKVEIHSALVKAIEKRFSSPERKKIKATFLSLKDNPYRGKLLTIIDDVLVKELKHGSYRFYFLASANLIRVLSKEDLEHEIIRFIKMSKKKEQQQVIDRILSDLKHAGFDFFKE